MPGFVVDFGTQMTCPHGGTVSFVPAGSPLVLIAGKPVATVADQLIVKGCSLTGSSSPCTKVQWINVGTTLVGGKAILLQSGPPPGPGNGTCLGSATPGPPILLFVQVQVAGT